MIIFLYECIFTGGAETLMMRIGKNARSIGLKTKIYCTQISDQMKKQYDENLIEIEVMKKWKVDTIIQKLSVDDIVFTFSLRVFLACKSYAQEKNRHNHIYLYMVQAKALNLERLAKLRVGRDFVRNMLKDTIYGFIYDGDVIFMDEMCIDWVEQFYGEKIENPKEKIYRLPMEDIIWDESKFQETMHKRREGFQILTIARADFPFKAYMKGLIKDFEILKKEYSYLKLKIVSYGPDIEELKKWIDEAYKSGTFDIELIGETRYDQLDKLYRESNLYVGMGTTLLDSAKYGVISLNALMYSYELKTTGFFHEFPCLLGAVENCCQCALERIKEVICCTNKEYERWAKESRRLAQENYSIDLFMDRVLSHNEKIDHKVPFLIRKSIGFVK